MCWKRKAHQPTSVRDRVLCCTFRNNTIAVSCKDTAQSRAEQSTIGREQRPHARTQELDALVRSVHVRPCVLDDDVVNIHIPRMITTAQEFPQQRCDVGRRVYDCRVKHRSKHGVQPHSGVFLGRGDSGNFSKASKKICLNKDTSSLNDS